MDKSTEMKGRLIVFEKSDDSGWLLTEHMRWTDTTEREFETDGNRWSHPYVPLMNWSDFGGIMKIMNENFHFHSTLLDTDNYSNTNGVLKSIQENAIVGTAIHSISEGIMRKFDETYLQTKQNTMCCKSDQKPDDPSIELIVVPIHDVPDALIVHQFIQGTMHVMKTFFLFYMKPSVGIQRAICLGRIINLNLSLDAPLDRTLLIEKISKAFSSLPKLAIRKWNTRITTGVILPTPGPSLVPTAIPTSTDKFFSGIINDIIRRKSNILSDFTDAFHYQSLTSALFIYFACLCPIITFGGILSQNTGNNIGTIESLLSGALCLIVFGLFSGQPMIIMGSTGPILVFETILHTFCNKYKIEYLNFRCSIGIWVFVIFLILVVTNGSNLVGYITRFTEDIFAALISIIYLIEAIKGLYKVYKEYPIKRCNETIVGFNSTKDGYSPKDTSNVFLMSAFLVFATYFLATWLQRVQQLKLFPLYIRNFISNVAVITTIGLMTLVDFYFGIPTHKLDIPLELVPSSPERQNGTWFVHPIGTNKLWHSFAAIGPALLASIIIFLDQQITAVIINKIPLIRKGSGYHLDLLVLSFLVLITSAFGLPWFVAATVLSLNHVRSLQNNHPKPFVREQRVTEVLIGIGIGCTITMAPILKNIPISVLFGVFIIMGSSSLGTIEFMKRIKLLFIPSNEHRDYRFMSHVPLTKINLFTAIQILSFGCLMVIKSFETTAILFPVMVLAMAFVRKFLEKIFTEHELYYLDDLYYGKLPPHIMSFYEMKYTYSSSMEMNKLASHKIRDEPATELPFYVKNNDNPSYLQDNPIVEQ